MQLQAQWEPGCPGTQNGSGCQDSLDLILPSFLVNFCWRSLSRLCWPVTADWDNMTPLSLLKCKAIFPSFPFLYFYHHKIINVTLVINNWHWVLQLTTAQNQFQGAAQKLLPKKADLGITQQFTCLPILFLPYTSSARRTRNLNHVPKCPVLNTQ